MLVSQPIYIQQLVIHTTVYKYFVESKRLEKKNEMLQPNSSPWKLSMTSQPILKTPEKKQLELSTNGSPLPSSFRFTPTKGKKLYPHLNPPERHLSSNINSSPSYGDHDESYMIKDNQSFVNAMDTLQTQLFSSNISNKVMNEFSSRYDKVREDTIHTIQEYNSKTTNEELSRRASGRFSSSHKNRFNRMESIAFHYAAKRTEKKEKEKLDTKNDSQRKLIQNNDDLFLNDDISLTPGDKRFGLQMWESASKRLRLGENKFKEIDSSPTKSLHEKEQLKNMYSSQKKHVQNNSNNTHSTQTVQKVSTTNNVKSSNVPSYLQPTKASLQKSNSSKQISPSKSSRSLHRGLADDATTPILRPIENSSRKSISKSPSLSPTRSITLNSSPVSNISPSRAYSNLNKLLNTPQNSSHEKEISKETPTVSEIPKTKLPRSRTLGPIHNNDQTSLPRSKTSLLGQNSQHLRNSTSMNASGFRSISGSSSIPRLARLATAENRAKQVSRHEETEKSLKPWR